MRLGTGRMRCDWLGRARGSTRRYGLPLPRHSATSGHGDTLPRKKNGMLKPVEFAFTEPCYSPDDGVLFSVYSMGRGYRAFTLSIEAACDKLGASTQQRQPVLLAFKLNHQRIARAIEGKETPEDGRRVVLEANDFE